MTVRTVLLAGGLGTRLHPLTEELPKPMIPVLSRPWLDLLVERLAQSGIRDITLSLRHGKQTVINYFQKNPPGIRLNFAVEPTPLGTGGAIRFAADGATNTILVFNADIVQTFDIQAFLQFHHDRQADVTIGLVQVDDPSPYGAVEMDRTGRIRRFVEKPKPGETESKFVNAGVYAFSPDALENIPYGREVSVEKETFPSLLAAGAMLFGYLCRGYWKDIGTRDRYLELHQDILDRRCPLPISGNVVGPSLWQSDGVFVSPSARLTPPVLLGPGTIVEEGAHVGPWVVTGKQCRVGRGARVSDAVLWDRVQINAGAMIRHSVLGDDMRVAGGKVENVLLAAGLR